jgi:hypothetical protein
MDEIQELKIKIARLEGEIEVLKGLLDEAYLPRYRYIPRYRYGDEKQW